MANNSDPDYNPNETEEESDDEILSEPDDEIPSETRITHDAHNESYSESESTSKKNESVRNLDDHGYASSLPETCNTRVRHRGYIYQCNFCYFQTFYRCSLKEHFKICKQTSSKKSWTCPRCNKYCTLKRLLEKHHLAQQEGSVVNIFRCPACSFEANKKMQVSIIENMHYKSRKLSVCPYCKKRRLFGIRNFKEHLFAKHSFNVPYKCEYCDYVTLDPKDLKGHQISHADMKEIGLIQCSHCHLDFFTLNDVKEHMKKILGEKAKNTRQIKNEEVEDMNVEKARNMGQIENEEVDDMNMEKDDTDVEREDEKSLSDESDDVMVYNSDKRDKTNLRQWSLKCKLCTYTNPYKANCHRHGLRHKTNRVTFYKFYKNKLKGSFDFRYPQYVKKINVSKLKSKSQKNEFTKAEDEKVTDNVKDDEDKEEECKSAEKIENNQHIITNVDSNINDESNETKECDLMEMKAEFFTCAKCNYETKCESYLPVHDMLVHAPRVGVEKLQCPDCEFATKYRHNMKRHLEVPHKYKIKRYITNLNDKVNDDGNNVRIEATKGSGGLNCKQCGVSFENIILWYRHTFKYHRKETVLQCPLCEFETRYVYSVKRHVINRHNYKIKRYTTNLGDSDINDDNAAHEKTTEKSDALHCAQCSRVYQDKYLWHWHMYKYHRDKTELLKWSIQCKLCHYETYSRKNARKHAIAKHSSSKKYTIVRFDKYYEDEFNGNLNLEIDGAHINRRDYHELCKTPSEPEQKENYVIEGNRGDLNSAISDLIADGENAIEKIDAFDGLEQTETIQIEITPDSDDEADISEGSIKNDEYMRVSTDSNEGNYDKNQEYADDTNRLTSVVHNESISDMETNSCSDDERNPSDPTAYPNLYRPKKIKCVHSGCDYKTGFNSNFKRHCVRFHQYGSKKLADLIPAYLFLCPMCKFRTSVHSDINKHMKINHDISDYVVGCRKCKRLFIGRYDHAFHMFTAHRDKTEILKWSLQCTLCSFESYSKRYAKKHAVRVHSSPLQPIAVKFREFYEDQFMGNYRYRCEKSKEHRCTECDLVLYNDESFRKHKNRHKNGLCKERSKRNMEKDADPVVDGTRTEDNILSGSYSEQQIINAIEPDFLITRDMDDNESNNESEQSLNFSDNENLENDEIIMIEITSDNQDNSTEKENNRDSYKLNPFTGELIAESKEKKESPEKSNGFKCSKIGCKYSCDSLRGIRNHIKSCKARTFTVSRRFTCKLCGDVLTKRNVLQTHANTHSKALNNPDLLVTFSENINNNFFGDFQIQANSDSDLDLQKTRTKMGNPSQPARVAYKCWMCGVLLLFKRSLPCHTNLHAREDHNPKLIVRYSKFRDEKVEGTVIMRPDPSYGLKKKVKVPEKSPELDYDPSLQVFSCDECSFKTNEEKALKKHKNLHWTSEKEAMFKAKKWLTCNICSFHCFNVETFKEHSEWHKKHPTFTGGIRKLGKHSWFLK